MRSAARWSAVLAVLLGVWAASAFAEDGPLAPKSLRMTSGDGAAISFDGSQWQDVVSGYYYRGLDLIRPTYVRGMARVQVSAGTFVEVGKGSVMIVSWEPSVRGWRFVALVGDITAFFSNTTTRIAQGSAITLTAGGELYRAPNGYAPSRVSGLSGLPEVSGFRPYEDDVR